MTASSNPALDDQWIGLLSGAQFNYNRPEESDVTLDDLANEQRKIDDIVRHVSEAFSSELSSIMNRTKRS